VIWARPVGLRWFAAGGGGCRTGVDLDRPALIADLAVKIAAVLLVLIDGGRSCARPAAAYGMRSPAGSFLEKNWA